MSGRPSDFLTAPFDVLEQASIEAQLAFWRVAEHCHAAGSDGVIASSDLELLTDHRERRELFARGLLVRGLGGVVIFGFALLRGRGLV